MKRWVYNLLSKREVERSETSEFNIGRSHVMSISLATLVLNCDLQNEQDYIAFAVVLEC